MDDPFVHSFLQVEVGGAVIAWVHCGFHWGGFVANQVEGEKHTFPLSLQSIAVKHKDSKLKITHLFG
jgi:hypothetical protein